MLQNVRVSLVRGEIRLRSIFLHKLMGAPSTDIE